MRATDLRRVVWASSTVVYGPAEAHGGRAVDEDAPRRPHSHYGLTKVLAEDIASYYRDRYSLEVCGLRLPLVFGPGLSYRGVVADLMRLFAQAAPGASLDVTGPAGRFDLIYVKDAADALLRIHAFSGALGEVYNVAGFTTSCPEIIAAVTDLVPGCSVRFAPDAAPSLPLLDAGRIAREIGVRPRFDLSSAVADHLASFKESRP